jgi:LDH2 family malate/lactate/ureidoglycolate dehydrogenase
MDDGAAQQPRLDADQLRALTTEIFRRCGMGDADAARLADSLVSADLRGVHSHGVLRVPEYVAKLTTGGVDPRGRPQLVRDGGPCLVVDGGNSMGQIGTQFALDLAGARARQAGIAAVAIRGSNHCGALAYYTLQAAQQDLIGLMTTNALPTMAPWGGADRILGINPLSSAVPAGQAYPLVYDGAFSHAAHGKVRIYQQRGQRLPEGWALDKDSRPTTDPTAALEGLLLPIGGYKGAGLAMLMGVLSSMLPGAAYGTELGDMEHGPTPGRDGHFVLVLQVAAFEEVGRFKQRVDAAVAELHACRLAPGFERVYAPGEPEFLTEEAYRRDGIPLTRATLEDLQRTAAALGVAWTQP